MFITIMFMTVTLTKSSGGYTCQGHSSTRQDANGGVSIFLAMETVSKAAQTPVQAACTIPTTQTIWELSRVSGSITATACTVRPCRFFFLISFLAN